MAEHIIMCCPLYEVKNRGPVAVLSSYSELVNIARDLKSIMSQLIKKRIPAQFN